MDVAQDDGKNEADLAEIKWTLHNFQLDELTDYYKNPRSLSEKEFKQLKTSLDKFGMIDKPIVNLDAGNTIIGGHQRKHVLEASGVKECECWVPDRELTDKEVEELNIRLNKNTGSWDFDTLANSWEVSDLLDWGFSEFDLGINNPIDPSAEWQGMPDYKNEDLKSFRQIIVHFKTQEDIDAFAELVGQKITERARYMWYPRAEIMRQGEVIEND